LPLHGFWEVLPGQFHGRARSRVEISIIPNSQIKRTILLRFSKPVKIFGLKAHSCCCESKWPAWRKGGSHVAPEVAG